MVNIACSDPERLRPEEESRHCSVGARTGLEDLSGPPERHHELERLPPELCRYRGREDLFEGCVRALGQNEEGKQAGRDQRHHVAVDERISEVGKRQEQELKNRVREGPDDQHARFELRLERRPGDVPSPVPYDDPWHADDRERENLPSGDHPDPTSHEDRDDEEDGETDVRELREPDAIGVVPCDELLDRRVRAEHEHRLPRRVDEQVEGVVSEGFLRTGRHAEHGDAQREQRRQAARAEHVCGVADELTEHYNGRPGERAVRPADTALLRTPWP